MSTDMDTASAHPDAELMRLWDELKAVQRARLAAADMSKEEDEASWEALDTLSKWIGAIRARTAEGVAIKLRTLLLFTDLLAHEPALLLDDHLEHPDLSQDWNSVTWRQAIRDLDRLASEGRA